MGETITDIAKEFALGFDELPTTEEIVSYLCHLLSMNIYLISMPLKQVQEISNCPGPSYARDYTATCPESWILQANGTCWGRGYRGPCESMHYFGAFDQARKEKFVR
ncbi:uncharacterized protein LOC113146929 [Cyclospora cayetanensis]|uniref:Uncharacterized protein LOC113146929 n=1 Tax=Cyclospora cayetanensis TaxID=88456 RepID=A0A6P6RWM1_9EIME|nr:uncharacterized protein LOC113146929 [Cyclospora cayetanensis]